MSLPVSKVHITACPKLCALPVQQFNVLVIFISEVCPQTKEACLPKELRVWRVVPVRAKEQVARIGTEDRVRTKQVTIAVAVEVKGPKNQREANLIVLRKIVEGFSLKIGKAKNRRVVGKMILVVNFAQQITNVAFAAGDQIRAARPGEWTVNHG